MKQTNKLSYTTAEVVRETGIPRTTIFAKMKTGVLPAKKLGKRNIILKTDLERFLESLPMRGTNVSGAPEHKRRLTLSDFANVGMCKATKNDA